MNIERHVATRRLAVAALAALCASVPAQAQPQGSPTRQISGMVHETKPTEDVGVADVRITVIGGELDGRTFTTSGDGAFTLPPVQSASVELTFQKAGYQASRLTWKTSSQPARLDVALMPEPGDVALNLSGADACVELKAPPEGLPGLREYARFPVHHDGRLHVRAARLPFFSNEGYIYRLTPAGWVKNEVDFILLRQDVPLRGGFVYVITFGGTGDRCGPWSIDAAHSR